MTWAAAETLSLQKHQRQVPSSCVQRAASVTWWELPAPRRGGSVVSTRAVLLGDCSLCGEHVNFLISFLAWTNTLFATKKPEWYRNRTRSGYRKYNLNVIRTWVGLAGLGGLKAANMHPSISPSQGPLYSASYCALRAERARLYLPSRTSHPPKSNPHTNGQMLWNSYRLHISGEEKEPFSVCLYRSSSSSQSNRNQISL